MFSLESLWGRWRGQRTPSPRAAWLFERLGRVSEMWVGRCRSKEEVRGKQGFPAVTPLLLEASGMEQASWLQSSEFPAAQFPLTFWSHRSYC